MRRRSEGVPAGVWGWCVFVYRKILVAFDGSKQSEKALRESCALAKACKARVAAIFVAEQLPLPRARDVGIEMVEAELSRMGALELRKASAIAGKAGVKLEQVYAAGSPAEEILRHAEKGGFDLVAVGVRGIGGVKRLLLGSVSGDVVHRAHCAVLVVK
ncbi:MAG: universal stress protein [Candidatus ainarchaeum sp.]|nr:universal stress protein [Candidatus ainarchaeum sp.]